MWELLRTLFGTADFNARWTCGRWTQFHGWLHICSDLAIAGAYLAIPTAIVFLMRRRRRELSYPGLYALFATFILSCGLTHLIDASLFWQPWYRFSGLVKVITALASWATVVTLIRIMPAALKLPAALQTAERLRNEMEERRQAEEEVRQLNVRLSHRLEELEALLNVIPVGIGIATDPACAHIRTNPAFAGFLRLNREANASLGGPPGEKPTHFKVLQDGRELQPEELPIQLAARRGEPVHDFEEHVVFEDGSKITLLSSAVPLFDEHRQLRGAVGVFMDVTAAKKAEEDRLTIERKLLESQKLESLGVLAGGIAHDFNNLLTGVLGNASLARVELAATSPVQEQLDQIEKAAMRAADLCRQMLAYSGKGRFILQVLDLNQMVRETTPLVESSMGKRSLLKLELDRQVAPVRADPTQLRQIVMNLVINASEAIGERGGIITIRTRQVTADEAELAALDAAELSPGRYSCLEVSDNGCGMAPGTLAKIYDPFFTTKFTGRGLGLAAVLGIVRGHKGAIKVHSELSKGTTFKVLLPSVAEVLPVVEDEPLGSSRWTGAGTVLVVDDEDGVRAVTVQMLKRAGFRTVEARNGEEAVRQFRQNPAMDAVLMDLTMPKMDGEEAFRELRLIQPEVKVILMSGYNEQDAITRFTGKGLAGFLQKPFRLSDLKAKLQGILAS